MNVTETCLIIDDPYLVSFFSRKGTPEFMTMCTNLLRSLCTMCDMNPSNSTDEYLKSRFDIFRREMLDSLSTVNVKANLAPEFLNVITTRFDHMNEKLDMSKMVDTVARSELLLNTMTGIKTVTDTLSTKVDAFSVIRTTNRFKGDHGEHKLHDILEMSLQECDGYKISDTSSSAHNCDLNIKRSGYPDIRIESKAHGRDTGDCVKTVDVKRFEADLASLGTHGIMVSLYSGITGKSLIDMNIIPTTNKLAFYLSNNNFDGDTITNITKLIYKLDNVMSQNNPDNSIIITNESMNKIRSHLIDFNRRVEELKLNMKNASRLLNELSFDVIENLIMSTPVESTLSCDHCRLVFKNKSGLTQHKNKCIMNPTVLLKPAK